MPYQETLKLQISLNLTQGDKVIAFQVLMKLPNQETEKIIISSLRDGKKDIQRIKINPTVFGDRLFANFSKEEQMITIYLSKIDFVDDGLEFRSELHYTSKSAGYVIPAPSITTKISVTGKTLFVLKY